MPSLSSLTSTRRTSVVKRTVRAAKKKARSASATSLTALTSSTVAADVNARPVTRSEFQELVSAVTLLKKQLQRQLGVEAHVGSELELFSAHLASNKAALGTLAELVLEKTNEVQEHVTARLQQLQVESNQRLTDVQLAIERLEFRFKHHLRDCHSVAELVDLHQDTLVHLKTQLSQTQLAIDKQHDDQNMFMETTEYTTRSCETKVATATKECANNLELFQQRMTAFIQGVEESVQGSVNVVVAQVRELEIQNKRQRSLLHQSLDEQLEMRQNLKENDVRWSNLANAQDDLQGLRHEDNARLEELESKIGQLLMLVDRRLEKDEIEVLLERSERSMTARVEAVLELVNLCVQGMKQ